MRIFKLFLYILVLFISSVFLSCNGIKNSFSFFPDRDFSLSRENLPKNISEKFIITDDKIKLHSYYLSGKQRNENLIIYFHGNAGNASHRISDAQKLHKMGYDVLLLEYRGYGKSEGEASERGVYLDGEASLTYALKKLRYKSENIIFYGRSIGTTVAVHIAQDKKIGGVILITPLTSAREYVRSKSMGYFSFIVGDSFNSIGKINKVQAPVLVIHGTRDQIINFALGLRLYDHYKGKKKFIKIEGGDHNNLQRQNPALYWSSIKNFLKEL